MALIFLNNRFIMALRVTEYPCPSA